MIASFRRFFLSRIAFFDGWLGSLDPSGSLRFAVYFSAALIVFLDVLLYALLPFFLFLLSFLRGIFS
ncbi:MAG: hypothetical protein LBH25_04660 [Fibromonadaceae bacterium]|nr:hypothetical protein [Fibromonadaceae bacterium]